MCHCPRPRDTDAKCVIAPVPVTYGEIGNYAKPVLLMHGDRDGIVPISYAERAAEVYPNVDYYVIGGGGHGFYGNSLEDAFLHIFEYLKKIDVL